VKNNKYYYYYYYYYYYKLIIIIRSLLCNRPDSHLRVVFDNYQKRFKHSIEKAIEKEFSGDIKKALLGLVASIRNKNEYIATLYVEFKYLY